MVNVYLKLFGGSNNMRVLDYLLDLEVDVGITDICDGTDLSRKTVEKIVQSFVDEKVVRKTRIVGKTQMFSLNNAYPVVLKLIEINNLILKGQKEKKEMKTK